MPYLAVALSLITYSPPINNAGEPPLAIGNSGTLEPDLAGLTVKAPLPVPPSTAAVPLPPIFGKNPAPTLKAPLKIFSAPPFIASILLELGCRVFWNYAHTSLAQSEDVKKAKIKSKTLGFTGFIYNDEIKEEVKPIEKKEKEEIPDYKLIELGTLKSVKQDAVYVERKIKFSPHVKCEGKIKNQFYLSATGNVFPCKHVALTITTAENSPEHTTEFLYDWSKNNINNFTLEQIFTNDFYKGYFNNLLKLNPEIIHNEQGGTC